MATSGTMVSNRHGVKRAAEDSLEGEQRLAKRFNLLNLERNGKLWISATTTATPPEDELAQNFQATPNVSKRSEWSEDDHMLVEDTKDRIYIHNLDDELQSDEDVPEEERIVFLPDVERHLAAVPKHVLMGNKPSHPQAAGNELVLYSVPKSLSVPIEQDSVRKAIIESRARARQRLEEPAPGHAEDPTMEVKDAMAVNRHGVDEDAMDIG